MSVARDVLGWVCVAAFVAMVLLLVRCVQQ